jgi:hypothetical protein
MQSRQFASSPLAVHVGQPPPGDVRKVLAHEDEDLLVGSFGRGGAAAFRLYAALC